MEVEFGGDEKLKMVVDEAIMKTKKILEGHPELKFTMEEYQKFHQCVYDLCAFPRSFGNNTQWLYQKFKGGLEEGVISCVLPSLLDKHGEPLLRELILKWSNYKLMSKWLCRFFEYLDRCHVPEYKEVGFLKNTSINCFRDLVFNKFYSKFRAAALSLIIQERMDLHTDQDLLKNVVVTFMELNGANGVGFYEDFEEAMLQEASCFYSQSAQMWLLYDSMENYIKKVRWCLNKEKERARCYLPSSTAFKLDKVLIHHLLVLPMDKLIEKKRAENNGLATDYEELLSKCSSLTLQEGNTTSQHELEPLSAILGVQFTYDDFVLAGNNSQSFLLQNILTSSAVSDME